MIEVRWMRGGTGALLALAALLALSCGRVQSPQVPPASNGRADFTRFNRHLLRSKLNWSDRRGYCSVCKSHAGRVIKFTLRMSLMHNPASARIQSDAGPQAWVRRFLRVLWRFCLTCLAATACTDQPEPAWSGYAEGDYLYMAAPLAGRLEVLSVQIGQPVAQGATLFALDSDNEQAARAESAARLVAAQAQ